jgi:hypothetical protein
VALSGRSCSGPGTRGSRTPNPTFDSYFALQWPEARALGVARFERNDVAVGAHAFLGVNAPADAGTGAGNGGVGLGVDEHPLRADQAALWVRLFNLTDGLRDHRASPLKLGLTASALSAKRLKSTSRRGHREETATEITEENEATGGIPVLVPVLCEIASVPSA